MVLLILYSHASVLFGLVGSWSCDYRSSVGSILLSLEINESRLKRVYPLVREDVISHCGRPKRPMM